MAPSPEGYVRDYKQERRTARRRGELEDNKHRKRARRKAIRIGIIRQDDNRDIHHRNNNPKDNSRRNLLPQSASKNRSVRRK